MSWSVGNIAPILDASISEDYITSRNVELAITNKSTKIENLHLVDVQIKNTGNEMLTNGSLDFIFLNDAQCIRGRITGVSYSYKKKLCLSLDRIDRKYELKFEFMDPGQIVDVELLITNFSVDEFVVDCSLPSLRISAANL